MANYERHQWLALRQESALDPHRRIVDPHHHLWGRDDSRYLAEELVADTRRSHDVTHTVYVECSSSYDADSSAELAPVGETRFVAEQAARVREHGGVELAAIVSHADLMLGEAVADVLEVHESAGAGLFRGVRHGVNWSPHRDVKNGHHNPVPNQLGNDLFRAGIATLASMGHSFDAWLYFDQLTELAALAKARPDCVIVLNHLGGPLGIGPHASARDEMLAVWRQGMAEVACCDNVALKVGGIGMEHYYGTNWAELDAPPSSEEAAAYWADMVHFAIDTFGPSRCMFESNFPVDRQTLPYTVLWNAFEIMADRYTTEEQHNLFFATAANTYRITQTQ